MEQVIEQVADTSTEQVVSTEIADQTAEPAPAASEERPKADAVQRRIDKLTRDKYQSRAEADMLRRELETLRSSRQEPQRQETRGSGEPRLEQFQNFEDFIAARDQYLESKFEEKLTARERKEQESRQQTEAAKASETWAKRLNDIRKEVPDYDDLIEAADVPVSQSMAQAITESDIGPRVALYLASHPEEAEAMLTLSPSATLRAIGRIEAKIEAEKTAPPVSKAPKPTSPVSGGGSGPKTLADASYDEFVKMRHKQLAGKR